MELIQLEDNNFVGIIASAMTPFFYNREFDSDIFIDLIHAFDHENIINQSLTNKIAWSLCKTFDNETLNYDLWIELTNFDHRIQWVSSLYRACAKGLEIEVEEIVTVEQQKPKKTKHYSARESALGILVNAKKMNLSFQELNILTMNDYISFVDLHTGVNKPRRATQEDIDRLFS